MSADHLKALAAHAEARRVTEKLAFNKGIDVASEIIAEWLAEGRDESVLFDKLQDARDWFV